MIKITVAKIEIGKIKIIAEKMSIHSFLFNISMMNNQHDDVDEEWLQSVTLHDIAKINAAVETGTLDEEPISDLLAGLFLKCFNSALTGSLYYECEDIMLYQNEFDTLKKLHFIIDGNSIVW